MLPTITVSWLRSAVTSQYQPVSRGDSQDTNRNYRQGNDRDIYFGIDVLCLQSSGNILVISPVRYLFFWVSKQVDIVVGCVMLCVVRVLVFRVILAPGDVLLSDNGEWWEPRHVERERERRDWLQCQSVPDESEGLVVTLADYITIRPNIVKQLSSN